VGWVAHLELRVKRMGCPEWRGSNPGKVEFFLINLGRFKKIKNFIPYQN
jgi:hypothetical protein